MADYALTTGSDTFTGTNGDDLFSGPPGGIDRLFGGDGADRFAYTFSNANPRGVINGGVGIDTLVASNLLGLALSDLEVLETAQITATIVQIDQFETFVNPNGVGARITVRPQDGGTIDFGSKVTALGIEFTSFLEAAIDLTGSTGHDILYGSYLDDTIDGGMGTDTLYGYGGSNHLDGGDGNDTIFSTGTDTIEGGAGRDTIYDQSDIVDIDAGSGNDFINLETFVTPITGQLAGGLGNDTLILRQYHDISAMSLTGFETLQADVVRITLAQIDSFSFFEYYSVLQNTLNLGIAGSGGIVDLSGKLATGRPLYIGASEATSAVNIVGSASNDEFVGSPFDDTLDGGVGNDRLGGYAGRDTLLGGEGDDFFYPSVSTSASDVTAVGGAGSDRLYASEDASSASIGLFDGGDGIDRVIGGSISYMNGFIFTNVEILEAEHAVGTITQFLSFETLTRFGSDGPVELELTGVGGEFDLSSRITPGHSAIVNGTASESGLRLTGTALDDRLTGSSFEDAFVGTGGADRLEGGDNNDVYVNPENDTIVEAGGDAAGAHDVVQSDVNFSLSGIANVEDLTLTGAADTTGIGNELANLVTGNSGKNTLDGGPGADILAGGAGDDTYVNPTSDTVIELAGAANGARDLILSNASFNLAAAPNVEDITLTGTARINAIGSNANNRLTGNDANNVLNGAGGNDFLIGLGGADTMNGGAGNDVYVNPVNGVDSIVEAAGVAGGLHDRIQTLTGFNLSSVANVEDITLVGAANVNAIGNNLANILVGNAGANTLNGGGGADTITGAAGNDTMNGGAGADLFKFAASATGADTIGGFETALDRFDLSGGGFSSRTESGGNTTLTHAGGSIVVTGVTGLALAAWNGLVVGGARAAAAEEAPYAGRFAAHHGADDAAHRHAAGPHAAGWHADYLA